MFLSTNGKKLAKFVACVALLQGITWLTLCIIGLVKVANPPDLLSTNYYDNYSDYLSRIIYETYFKGRDNQIVSPKTFNVFLWIYTILSAIWIAASLDQYLALKKDNKRQVYLAVILGVVVFVTSVIDIILVFLLARDLSYCSFSIYIGSSSTSRRQDISTIESLTNITVGNNPFDCKISTGILMTIAGKGYVLWLINVSTSLALIANGNKVLSKPSLFKYGKSVIPRPRLKRPKSNDTSSYLENHYANQPYTLRNSP